MKNILALIVLFCAVALGQGWNTTVTNVLYEPNLDKIDNFTNGSGIHILLRRTNGNIIYYRLNSSGEVEISATTIASSGDFPAITGSNDAIYVFYRIPGYIKGKYSADGKSWATLPDITTSSNICNGIDAIFGSDYTYDSGVHIAYGLSDSGNNYETYYRLLVSNPGYQWVNYKNVTDYLNEVGGKPSISLSNNRVHISYNTDPSEFGQGSVSTRDKMGNYWQNPIVAIDYPHNSINEKLIVRGSYVWLSYLEYYDTEFILRYKIKPIIANSWPDPSSTISYLVLTPPFSVCKTVDDALHYVFLEETNLVCKSYNGSWSYQLLDDNPQLFIDGTIISGVSNDLFTYWPHSNHYTYYKQYDAVPLPPTNITVEEDQEHHPELNWTRIEPDIDYYVLQKYESGWSNIITEENSYTDNDETYCTAVPPAECDYEQNIDYRVKAVDYSDLTSDPSETVIARVLGGPPSKEIPQTTAQIIPVKNSLDQNYPNPFNPNTSIYYSLKKPGEVSLKVYNMLGQEVAELVNEVQSEGYHSVEFNASNLPSGIYIYQIRAGDFSDIKKMMLVK